MKKAFTLIEVTVIITILSILLTTSLVVTRKINSYEKSSETEEKIERIQKALISYYRVNGILPCPADLTTEINNSSFGDAEDNGSSCTTSSGLKNIGSNDNFYGGVPIKALNLNISDAFDAWEQRISYVVPGFMRVNIKNTDRECYIDSKNRASLNIDNDQPTTIIGVNQHSGASCELDFNTDEPTYSSGTIMFDGSNDSFRTNGTESSPMFDFSTGYTLFMVTQAPFDSAVGAYVPIINARADGSGTASGWVHREQYSIHLNGGGNPYLNFILYNRNGGSINSSSYSLSNGTEFNTTEPVVASITRASSSSITNIRINNNTYSNVNSLSFPGPGSYSNYSASRMEISKLRESTSTIVFGEFTLHEIILYSAQIGSTDKNHIHNYLLEKHSPTYITDLSVLDKNSADIDAAVAFILLSHGENSAGAYNSAGVVATSASSGLDQTNSFASNSGTFYSDFLNADQNLGKGWQKDFDDILRTISILDLEERSGR